MGKGLKSNFPQKKCHGIHVFENIEKHKKVTLQTSIRINTRLHWLYAIINLEIYVI